jgi:tripartite-type tricarboxylate transporter receptor subunit TctC
MKSSLRQTATPQHRLRPRGNERPYPKSRPWGQHPRRQFLRLAVGAAALPAVSRTARAQTYPTKPVRLIVGFAAGGGTDITARLMGQWLSERLGQPFITENRPGASGNIATEAVVRAPPDGYTLLVFGSTAAINTNFSGKLNYDFLRDIAPVAGIIRAPNVMLVNPSVPAKTIPEFIAYSKANPSKINMGSAGIGEITHLAGELFKMMTGVNMLHVPYRGGAPAITDIIGGQIQVLFTSVATASEYIKAGKVRALGVTTQTRSAALPDIPTVGEFVSGYEASFWHGLGAPKNTPTEIVEKLNKEINAALADPKLKARFADLGGMPLAFSPAEFGKLIGDETEKWAKVIRGQHQDTMTRTQAKFVTERRTGGPGSAAVRRRYPSSAR